MANDQTILEKIIVTLGTITSTSTTYLIERKRNMKDEKGYLEGIAVTLGIGLLTSLLVKWLGSAWLHPIAGTLLAYITLVACILYFGVNGLRTIPVGFRAMKLWLGKRVEGKEYPEGVVWNWPKPLGDLEVKDCRDKPLDLPLSAVLTADNVPVDIDGALQIKITDINKNLGADKPEESLKNAAESDIRSIVLRLQSSTVAQEKQLIASALMGQTPIEGLLLKGLADSEDLWGITVSQVRITHIRLPQKLEEARTEIQIRAARLGQETEDAKAEKVAINNLAARIKTLKGTGLEPSEAVDAVQAEFGKITRVVLGGGAKPIERAGALAGGLLNNVTAPTQSSQPPSANPVSKGSRRRGNS